MDLPASDTSLSAAVPHPFPVWTIKHFTFISPNNRNSYHGYPGSVRIHQLPILYCHFQLDLCDLLRLRLPSISDVVSYVRRMSMLTYFVCSC